MLRTITFLSLLFLSSVASAQNKDTLIVDLQSLQKSSWSEQEQQNAKIITDFVQNLMNNHNFDYVLSKYNNSAYVQHNRNLPDEIAGLVGFLRDFVEDYPEYAYDVKHIYADGDFIIFYSHATLDKEDRGNDQKGMNIMDIWRLENGQIIEHWDSIQGVDSFMRFYALLSGGDINNDNGVF